VGDLPRAVSPPHPQKTEAIQAGFGSPPRVSLVLLYLKSNRHRKTLSASKGAHSQHLHTWRRGDEFANWPQAADMPMI